MHAAPGAVFPSWFGGGRLRPAPAPGCANYWAVEPTATGDPVAVSASDDSLTDLSSGDNVSVTDVGDSSDSNPYSDTGTEHTQHGWWSQRREQAAATDRVLRDPT